MAEGGADNVVPNSSRDEKWICFASDRTGNYQVWKMPAGRGEAIQVTGQVDLPQRNRWTGSFFTLRSALGILISIEYPPVAD